MSLRVGSLTGRCEDRLGLEAVSRTSWFSFRDGLGWVTVIEIFKHSQDNHWLVLAASITQNLQILSR